MEKITIMGQALGGLLLGLSFSVSFSSGLAVGRVGRKKVPVGIAP